MTKISHLYSSVAHLDLYEDVSRGINRDLEWVGGDMRDWSEVCLGAVTFARIRVITLTTSVLYQAAT